MAFVVRAGPAGGNSILATIAMALALTSVLSSCGFIEKAPATRSRPSAKFIDHTGGRGVRLPQEAPAAFRQAMKEFDQGEYGKAQRLFEDFIVAHPTSSWTQSARFHSGRALEAMSRWSEAAERYRLVADATGNRNAPKLQAMALYRISHCREALGDDQHMVAALNDLLPRKSFLPREIAEAELPGRLAGAYARTGNFEKAVDFYMMAERGIRRLKSDPDEVLQPDWLPRTLFYMGAMSARSVGWEDFETALRPLARSQVYLLQTAELDAQPWAGQAADELMKIYGQLWNVIETASLAPGVDPLIGQRDLERRQWERAVLLQEILQELRSRALPEDKGASEHSRAILEFGKDLEGKIFALFSKRPTGEGLTPEAQMRRRGVRGRVISPNDSLEKKFLDESRAYETDGSSQDPNL
jgi:tetratricopeptide (TPR) repeat protein